MKSESSETEFDPTSFGPDLQVSGRAQTLGVLREALPAKAQRIPNGDVFAPAHVGQQARDEQPDWQEQQGVKVR